MIVVLCMFEFVGFVCFELLVGEEIEVFYYCIFCLRLDWELMEVFVRFCD